MKKNIVISKETDDLIKKTATKEGITQSQLIEMLISQQLNSWKLQYSMSKDYIPIVTREIKPIKSKANKLITISKSTDDLIKMIGKREDINQSTVIEMLVLQQLKSKIKKKDNNYEPDRELLDHTY